MRGGSLLSLAKYKIVFYPLGVSLSIKNLFGLVPGLSRGKYHGEEHAFLDQSIVDINKIYRSLFSMKGLLKRCIRPGIWKLRWSIPEPIQAAAKPLPAKTRSPWMLSRLPLAGATQKVGHLRLAAQTFGAWDPQICADAAQSGIKILDL